MANPQPDKHIRISTELFEALIRTRISGEARQVFDFIMRKTWGFNKLSDDIAISQFSKATGIKKRHYVIRALNKLKEMRIIHSTKKGTRDVVNYSIQKDYDKWLIVPKKVASTKKGENLVPKKVKPSTKKGTNNRHTTINNIQKTVLETNKRFIKPNLDEVTHFCKERNNGIDAQYFIDSNEAKGWVIGKNRTPMKDWKATIRTWERNNKPKQDDFSQAWKSEDGRL